MGLSAGPQPAPRRRGQPAPQRFVQRYGFRLGAARFVAGREPRRRRARPPRLNDKGLLTNTTLLGEGVTTEAETRAVVAAYRELLDRIARRRAPDERRAQAHAPRPLDRRGARAARTSRELVEHAARARQLRPHRHGGVGARRRRRSASTAGSARAGTTTSAPSSSRTSSAARRTLRRCCRSLRTSASSRARTSSRRRSRTREKSDVDAAYVRLLESVARRRRLHRDRDARRDAHRARDRVRAGARDPEGALPVPDALRRPAAPAARPRRAAATPSSSPRRTAPTGTATSCAGSPSGRRTCSSSCGTSFAAEPGNEQHAGDRDEGQVAREEVPRPRRPVIEGERTSSSTGTTSASGRARAGGSAPATTPASPERGQRTGRAR